MTTKNITKKRNYIAKAIATGRYNSEHCALWEKMSHSSSNLDGIIDDIGNFSHSTTGINQSNVNYAVDKVRSFENPIFITFTVRFDKSKDDLASDFLSTINHVSKKLFKNAYKRHGKRIEQIAYIEGGDDADQRIHIHAVVDIPVITDMTETEFKKIISDHWYKTNGNIDFKVIEDNVKARKVVASYITKLKSKDDSLNIQEALVI